MKISKFVFSFVRNLLIQAHYSTCNTFVAVNDLGSVVGRRSRFQKQRLTDLESDGKVDVTTHVLAPITVNNNAQKPRQRRDARHDRHQHHPEPQEQVDLLVEQVDWQDALDRVAVHSAQAANLQSKANNRILLPSPI